jgi:drug/metabolite transporter (DMT)-like permease
LPTPVFSQVLYAVFTPFLLWIGSRTSALGDLIAVTLAGIGAFMLSTGGQMQVQPGDSIELVGSLFWALHFVVLGKYASQFESISFASGHFIISGFLNFVIGLFVEDISILSALPVIGAVIYRATLSIGIGYTLQVWGQKHTPPTDAALILGLEAVFAVLAAWLALKQTLLPIQMIGCIVIFVAVLISQFTAWTSGKIEHDHLVEGR